MRSRAGRSQAAITVDVDSLQALYQGRGCRRPGGYSGEEFRQGLTNLCDFLKPHGIRATLFMVGSDFRDSANHDVIRRLVVEGHEIANHTQSHAQDFRLLSAAAKEEEIAGLEEACLDVTGTRPVGFRSPGWNMGDDALPILRRRGYLYDSSVFPSSLNPLLKFLHWRSTADWPASRRTTLGRWRYMFAPTSPYRTTEDALGRRGDAPFVEFPVTVVPGLRLPFFATFHLATGLGPFHASYRALRALGRPLQYQLHLTDFVDLTHGTLAEEVPSGAGVYVPQAFRMTLDEKLAVFGPIVETISSDYSFVTLAEWAKQLLGP